MEALRYLPRLSESGYIVTNTTPLLNIPGYPDLNKILNEIQKQPHFVAIDAEKMRISCDEGILEVRIPRKKAQRIE